MTECPHQRRRVSRREFLKTGLVGSAALLVSSACSFAAPSDAESSFFLPDRPTCSPTPTQMFPTPIGDYNPDWAIVFYVQDAFGEMREKILETHSNV
jgi:hypothetical protein